jgi:hypothetical protein
MAGGDAADHIDLVVLGGGQQQIRIRRARLAQALGVGGAALKADHVQRIGELTDPVGIVVDDGDVMALIRQDGGDGVSDLSAAGDDDFHGRSLRFARFSIGCFIIPPCFPIVQLRNSSSSAIITA